MDPRVAAALREYLERLDQGESVDVEKFVSEHAEVANALRSFIAAENQIRQLAREDTPRDRGEISTQSFSMAGQETGGRQRSAKPQAERGRQLDGKFGRYRIIRVLGSGAMGTVYLAEDTQLEREVAIKTPLFSDDPAGELLARFHREARAAATLRHANICPVYDVGQIDGTHYISMAYIEGRPLSALIRPDKPQTERQILIALHKLADAIQQAHDRGIVHRDLKPANIMVDKQGEPIIMDFGLARKAQREGDRSLTHTGMILGSPAYMSPEQVEGDADKVGPASDQYGLGVIVYQMLTGQLPFRGSIMNVLAQVISKEVVAPRQLRPDIDPRIEALCLKMMAKKPSDRYPSVKAVADEVASILKSAAKPSRSKDKSAPVIALPGADQSPPETTSSRILNPTEQKGVQEESARKYLARRDYDQVIRLIERIPEERRTDALQELLEKSREKADEIAFLICEIDDAERAHDSRSALQKARELARLKPGHPRARQIQAKYSGSDEEDAEPKRTPRRPSAPRKKRSWIPWSAAAVVMTVVVVACAAIFFYPRKARTPRDLEEGLSENAQPAATQPGSETPSATAPSPSPIPVLVAPFDESAAKARQEEWAAYLKTPVRLTNSIGMPLALIPPGEFRMGSPDSDPMADGYEKPQHTVRITRPMYVGIYEVTRGEFAQFVAATNHKTQAEKDGHAPSIEGQDGNYNWRNPGFEQNERHPVVDLSLHDVAGFCDWLSQKEGETYRLPSESEWEYCCRAGTTTINSSGDTLESLEGTANFRYLNAHSNGGAPTTGPQYSYTAPVGSFRPNHFGLFDMQGNAWEMCRDWFGDTYACAPRDDPGGAVFGTLHVSRGGAFNTWPQASRAAYRYRFGPSATDPNLGFRVVRTVADRSKGDVDRGKNEPVVKQGGPHPLVAPFDESAARRGQHEWADMLKLPVEVTNSLGMKLILIPPGEFKMGSADSRLNPNTRPLHDVRITKPFYLGVYEVTQAEYLRVMSTNPSGHHDDPRLPVEGLGYGDVLEFCHRLTVSPDEKRAGRTYRYPTEAEWEYACRAGTQTLFYFGDSMKSRLANFDTSEPGLGGLKAPAPLSPMKVGSFPPNAFGLYDMLGNVWEGVSDWYAADYYAHSPLEDPQGPRSGTLAIARGGSYATPPTPAAHRELGQRVGMAYQTAGFRVAFSIPAPVSSAGSD